MATPQTPYDAVLHAARDVTKLESALDAEMLGSALLGSVYAIAETDRDAAVREFVTGFLAATARRRIAAATTIRQVFATLVPTAEGADRVRPGSQAPTWTAQLGRVHLTGTWAYGDVYGDQTSYLATFAYDDESGGPEHALVALVDHNIGITKDIFVGGPAERILDQVRQMCADDELTWFRTEDPARFRGRGGSPPGGHRRPGRVARRGVTRHRPGIGRGPAGDAAHRGRPDRSGGGRAALRGRAHRPGPTVPRRAGGRPLRADAVDGRIGLAALLPEPAAGPLGELPGRRPDALEPAVSGLFLLDSGAPPRAVLDMDDAAMLPRVLRAWARYASRQRGLSEAAATRTDEAIEEMVPEFARLYSTGERRSAATAAVAQLMADGVDPDDPAALDAWIEANRHRLADDGA